MLQSSIARLDGSLQEFNRNMFCAFCLMEMSRLVEVTCLTNIMSHRNATRGKNVSTMELSKLHTKYGVVPYVDMRINIKL